MIPESFIVSWRENVKWQTPGQVEQDLVISKALVCLYQDSHIADSLIFRGGTALNKLFIKPPARYSEDIDFVQKRAEPIGATIEKIRGVLNPWLGDPKWKAGTRGFKLFYQYKNIDGFPVKLKVEINTTEHFRALPLRYEPFSVKSEWFSGSCQIQTYEPAELIATKIRAFYQRRKGRDLFDLWYVLKHDLVETDSIIDIFRQYCANDGLLISAELFRKNLELKKLNRDFREDMNVLLPYKTEWDFDDAYNLVLNNLINRL